MYKLIVAGGTFDLLHSGHKSFLKNILDKTDRLILGLTSDQYVTSNKLGNIENYETRKENLENYFASIGKKDFVEIVSIDDVFGPLLSADFNPDVIAVTDATKYSVETINKSRESLGLQILPSIIIPMDLAEDGSEVSSTRIRNGEIDREGELYFKKEWNGKKFVLPESLRDELSRPFGKVLQDIPEDLDGSRTTTVGDETTKLFNEKNVRQLLSILDLKIKREKKFESIKELGFDHEIKVYNIKNNQGEISAELLQAIKLSFEKEERSVILIDGEDDLAVLPAIIIAPLGFKIFYGQPNQGLVEVLVSEENKSKAKELLSSFEIE